jgi:hypothetical protein
VNEHPDVSLRASSATYVDRRRESDLILERLHRSSSSVIGIAGVRGAGKSSLALKVLERCDGSGYFTLLIPSPIGYDGQEFLVSLYQRVCEAVVSRLESVLGEAVSLDAMGRAEIGRLRRRFYIIVIGGLALVGVSFGYSAFEYIKLSDARRSAEARASIDRLKQQAADAKARLADAEAKVVHLKETKTVDMDALRNAETALIQGVHDVEYTQRQLDVSARRASETPAIVIYGTTIPLIFVILLGYGIVIFVLLSGRRIRARYKRLHRYPLYTGLYQQAQGNLEYLRYQATLKTTSEAGGTLYGLAAKFSRGKDLARRPMSLPGITAECNVFLSQVADVMGGKVVVCLDELDKIADPEQLASLLRGVKGLFGQRRHYFLLTVSEDALSAFAARRQGDRNILESSFEEILYLDRISVPLATVIISRMTGTPQNGDGQKFADNCALLWAFGFGIPREIKRNVLICESAGRNLHADEPLVIWLVLYRSLVQSLHHWVLVAVRDATRSYIAPAMPRRHRNASGHSP